MSSKGSQSVLLLSFLIFSTFAVIVGTSIVGDRKLQSNQPLAQSNQDNIVDFPYCPMSVEVGLYERLSSGETVPLNINNHPDIDPFAWGLQDNLHTEQPLRFQAYEPFSYNSYASELSMVELPEHSEVYVRGNTTSLTLLYQDEYFSIVKGEVVDCSVDGQDRWLCGQQNTQSIDRISDIALQCGLQLKINWTLERSNNTNTLNVQEADTQSLVDICDLNADGVCNTFDLFLVIDQWGKKGNTLTGDANNDGHVNALDYTIVAPSSQ